MASTSLFAPTPAKAPAGFAAETGGETLEGRETRLASSYEDALRLSRAGQTQQAQVWSLTALCCSAGLLSLELKVQDLACASTAWSFPACKLLILHGCNTTALPISRAQRAGCCSQYSNSCQKLTAGAAGGHPSRSCCPSLWSCRTIAANVSVPPDSQASISGAEEPCRDASRKQCYGTAGS